MSRTLTSTQTPGIYKRGGRYVVVLRDRERRQFKRFAQTLAEAREIKATLGADLARGEILVSRRTPFAQYAGEWLDTYTGRTARGIRPETMRGYRDSIERYAIPFFGGRPLDDIQLREIKRFAAHLAGRGLSNNSVRLHIAPLRALFATAVEEGVLRVNPTLGFRNTYGYRRQDEERPRALTDAQLAGLLEATFEPYRLLIRFLAETGLRIGEAAALTWADLDLGAGTVSVKRRYYRGTLAPPKSRHGIRTIPLSPDMVAVLAGEHAATLPLPGTLVFPAPGGQYLDARALLPCFKRWAKRAGVEWANLHMLRHTCASRLFASGWNAMQVQKMLGHHSPAFTMDTYVHLLADDDLPTLTVPAPPPCIACRNQQLG